MDSGCQGKSLIFAFLRKQDGQEVSIPALFLLPDLLVFLHMLTSPPPFSLKFLSGMSVLLLALLCVCLLYVLTDLRGGTAVGTENKCGGIFSPHFFYL